MRSRVTLLLSSLLLLCTIDAGATTYHVRVDGNDSASGLNNTNNATTGAWRHIQKCGSESGDVGNTLQPGDTCIIHDGTYIEPEVDFFHSGTVSARITVQAEHQGLAILQSTANLVFPDCNHNIRIIASYITIDGLSFTVDPSDVGCTRGLGGYPMMIMAEETNQSSPSSPSTGTKGLWVKNNTFNFSPKRGTGVKTRQDDSLIENNIIHRSVELMWNDNNVLRNNQIYADSGSDPAVVLKGGLRNALVYNNTIHLLSNDQRGIIMGGCSCPTCHFDPATQYEVYNSVAFNNVIINEAGTSNGAAGLVFRGTSNSYLFNNVVINMNPAAFEVALGGSCGSFTVSNDNPTMLNNIFTGNNLFSVNAFTNFTGTKTIDYNDFYQFTSGVPTQTHPITGNPLFVNPASDWHLQSGSPGINSGTVVTANKYGGGTHVVNFDAGGTARPVGLTWDLGVWEFLLTNAVYWARPNGTHNITGNVNFCNSIRSTDASHSSTANASAPSTYGTIGAAVACAQVGGDIVNIRGDSGAYSNTTNHRIKSDNASITPSFALASGLSASQRTILQGAPGDPRPQLNVGDWFSTHLDNTPATSRRHYIHIKYLSINGAGGSFGSGGSIIQAEGLFYKLEDLQLTNAPEHTIISFVNDQTLESQNIGLEVDRVFTNASGVNQGQGYSMYTNGAQQNIHDSSFIGGRGVGIQIYHSDTGFTGNADDSTITRNYIEPWKSTDTTQNNGLCQGVAHDGSRSVLSNNVVYMLNCGTGLTSGDGIAIGYGAGGSSVQTKVYNNTVIGAISFGLNAVGGSQHQRINNLLVQNANGVGNAGLFSVNTTNIVSTSALTTFFVSGTDFHLRTGTNPAVDQGTTISAVPVDKDLVPRAQGPAYDIGAYERPLSGTPPAPPTGVTIQ